MQLRCIAIDDEPLALSLLREYISKFPALELVGSFEDAIEGKEFLRTQPVDLLFIDINMPDLNGVDLVRSLVTKPMVVFTTAHKKFALEGFELDAIDYLLKPVSFERFEKAANKAIDFYGYRQATQKERPESIFVRSEYQLVKIDLKEIEYIESLEDYLKIHRSGQKPVMTLMTLKAMLEKLPSDQFIRIHRSYVIPIAGIKALVNRKVKLEKVELPISDSYAEQINNLVKK